MDRKTLLAARAQVRGMAALGLPFEIAAAYCADWMRRHNVPITVANLEAAFIAWD